MELAVNDLAAHIEARRNQRLHLHCIRYAQQALSALAYLHEKNVTHRDLKLCNILVTMWDQNSDILTIKLADFGISSYNTMHHNVCGTEGYMAPELLPEVWGEDGRTKLPYTKAVKIFAMGKILSELLSTYSSEKHRGSSSIIGLIKEMMSPIAEDRPTAAECLDSRWLRPEKILSKVVDKKRKASFDLTNDREQEFCQGTRPPPNSLVDVSNAVIVRQGRKRMR